MIDDKQATDQLPAAMAGPSRAEQLAETLERAGEFGQAVARRLAQPPRGGHVLRWAASWLAYSLLLVALGWLWTARPPAVVWVALFVIAAEVSLPVESEHLLRHWVWIVMVTFAFGAAAGWAYAGIPEHALPRGLQGGMDAVLLIMIAGALNRAPMNAVILWSERLGRWALGLWAWFLVYVVLAATGLSLLHPVVAAIDPPYQQVFDAVVQGAAFVVAAAAAASAIWLVFRAHRLRHTEVA